MVSKHALPQCLLEGEFRFIEEKQFKHSSNYNLSLSGTKFTKISFKISIFDIVFKYNIMNEKIRHFVGSTFSSTQFYILLKIFQ